jgi:hypothetical protein
MSGAVIICRPEETVNLRLLSAFELRQKIRVVEYATQFINASRTGPRTNSGPRT